ncbi:hypothetical protein BLD25_01395 [Candidatus Gracilibacteria bacterium GN02-872]|nr:hypothetical protein BLD25_01395 [Candidatus Gracilibacteria bacterium GN02-872]
MQYKIPIQIENEDPIVFGLSLRQLAICGGGLGIGYVTFTSLQGVTGSSWAAFFALIPCIFGILIALFKFSEMTFMVFVFNYLRSWVNGGERRWQQGVDSFSALDIGYIIISEKSDKKIDMGKKMEKIKNMEEQLKNI